MRLAVVLLAAAALAWPAAATANGDPASDALLVRDIFFPYQGISSGPEQTLKNAVAEAKRRGYTIRIALIASKTDLGLIPGLFEKPQDYAKFLWQEIQFAYKGRLLVVMPNGFGYWEQGGRAVRAAHEKIDGIEIGEGPDGLACAGAEAVRKLAGRKPLAKPCGNAGGGGSSPWRDRLLIAAGGTVLIAGAAYLLGRVRRRPQGGSPSS
ncbi:MAG: hypothetical protein M3R70_04890 [Actinomycetota bacterium]|nr:hypothetical protein [Actinomycetota bacterium]